MDHFKINDKDSCEILDTIAKTSIENFSISVFIKIVNKINMEQLLDYKNGLILACDYFSTILTLRHISECFKIETRRSGILESMHIVVSELLKHSSPFTLKYFLKKFFSKNEDVKVKILNLTEVNYCKKKSEIYLYNFIEAFISLEVLILSNKNIDSVYLKWLRKAFKNSKNCTL